MERMNNTKNVTYLNVLIPDQIEGDKERQLSNYMNIPNAKLEYKSISW